MSLGATELRGTIAVTPCAALRRVLYPFGAEFLWTGSAPLPARLRLPPGRGCVGFQYVKGDIASISKISKIRAIDIIWLSRLKCFLTFFHNLFPVRFFRSCRCCNQCSNKGKVNCALKTGKFAR